jgi:RNA recognition motif-containing protein
MTIYIGNVPYEAEDEDLRNEISQISPIKHSLIVRDKKTGRSKGFAFVTLMNEEDDEKVIEELDGKELMDRKLRVIKAHSKTLKMPDDKS